MIKSATISYSLTPEGNYVSEEHIESHLAPCYRGLSQYFELPLNKPKRLHFTFRQGLKKRKDEYVVYVSAGDQMDFLYVLYENDNKMVKETVPEDFMISPLELLNIPVLDDSILVRLTLSLEYSK